MNQLPPGESNRPELIRPDSYRVSPPARPQYADYSADDARPAQPSSGILEYWRILQRHKGAVALAAFLGTLAAVLFTLPQTPVYQARTTLELQGVNEDFMHMRDMNPTADSASGYYPDLDIQTQANGDNCFKARISFINVAGPRARVELVDEAGTRFDVEVPHARFHELRIETGRWVLVSPRRLKVFTGRAPASISRPTGP